MKLINVGCSPNWATPDITIDISSSAIKQAFAWFMDTFQVVPTTALVPPSSVETTYMILRDYLPTTRLYVVAVPGMPKGSWIVCGAQGGVICGGA